MITLHDILTDLEFGELNQFSLSGKIDGPVGIMPDDYPKLISAINLGLTDLHTKLIIREREVTVTMFDGMSYYKLDSRYSVNSQGFPQYTPKYIQDTPEYLFNDDVIQLRRFFNECGEELNVNDSKDDSGVFINTYNTFQVCSVPGDAIVITYQANHPKIHLDAGLDTEIEIPEYLREALYAFVMNRILMRSQNVEAVGVANAYRMKYETIINDIKRLNSLATQDNTMFTKLERKGWV